MARRISTQWTKNLKDQKSKESFELKLRSMYTDPVFKRFIEMMTERYEQNNKNRSDYTNAAWAYEQAHINGQQQLLEELFSLFLINDKE